MYRAAKAFVILLFMGSIGASTGMAQTNTGEIIGVVKDSSGLVLPGASVTARHTATGFVLERPSDPGGRFSLPALPIGQWDITVALPGFSPQTAAAVVEIGRTLDLEFTLSVQGIVEGITVAVSAQPLLQTATAEISDVIENREVVQIPLNGRNFLSLAQLSDAVGHPAGRHARRSASAGGSSAERRRAAIRPQHLPSRRRQGHG